jgi:outer membrane protein W
MKKSLLFILFISYSVLGWAQLERKIALTAALGTPFYNKAGAVQSENIYTGYNSIPGVRVGLQYNINHFIGIGPVLGFSYGTKPNYSMATSQVGLAAKYNIIPFDKAFSPFITVEVDLNYITISQKANAATETPTVNDDPQHIIPTSKVHNYPEIKTGFTSTGAIIGVGTDFTLKKKYTLFTSINYVLTNSASSYTSTSLFPENTSKLNYMLLQVGMRFAFGQSKSLY